MVSQSGLSGPIQSCFWASILLLYSLSEPTWEKSGEGEIGPALPFCFFGKNVIL
jgi:hypothetical protein